MMCVREATKSVRRWGILLRMFVFLYAFTLPHFIVDYIIRNDLFVPSSIYRQGISTHTHGWGKKIFDIRYEFATVNVVNGQRAFDKVL